MSKEELDSLFKNKLKGHQRKPSANAWDRLENKLDEEIPARTGITWWQLAAAVLLLFTVGMIWWNVSPENPLAQKQDNGATKDTVQQTMPEVTQDQAPMLAEEKVTENTPDQDTVQDSRPPKVQTLPRIAANEDKINREMQQTDPDPIPDLNETNATEAVAVIDGLPDKPVDDSRIASAEIVTDAEKASDGALRFRIEEFDEALLPDEKQTDSLQADSDKKKGLKKLWATVKSVQQLDAGIGDLREAKNELLSFNKEETEKP